MREVSVGEMFLADSIKEVLGTEGLSPKKMLREIYNIIKCAEDNAIYFPRMLKEAIEIEALKEEK